MATALPAAPLWASRSRIVAIQSLPMRSTAQCSIRPRRIGQRGLPSCPNSASPTFAVRLDGKRPHVMVLFSDIRGFTIIHSMPHYSLDGALVIKEVLHLQPHLHFACAAVLLLALTQDLGHNIAAGIGESSGVGVREETHPGPS